MAADAGTPAGHGHGERRRPCLPDLTQAWAWAHAQILGGAGRAGHRLRRRHRRRAARRRRRRGRCARLLCPRQLRPQTSYQAFLVPTFERGRLAGLGQPASGIDRLAPAWQPGQAAGHAAGLLQLELPDRRGRRLRVAGRPSCTRSARCPGRRVAARPRRQPARARDPANVAGRCDLAARSMPVGDTDGVGAGPASTSTGSPTALAAQANDAGHAARRRRCTDAGSRPRARLSTAAGATPPWFHQLNADPRARVAAGLGTLRRPDRAAAAARGRLGPGRGHPRRQRAAAAVPARPRALATPLHAAPHGAATRRA